ncbi:MAG TPA: fumarylacetoacetase [Steroidobacteraceae bacterium]|jgi:fumarylacetoacetase|nr:fumarylacetoacetase [Steroidobacteraceae bacterium]
MDTTHDLNLPCWVTSANGHDQFPIQNLPLGIFAPHGGKPRGGIAIGDSILDIGGLLTGYLSDADARTAAAAASEETLNRFLALGGKYRRALRHAVSHLLSTADAAADMRALVHPANECTLYLPAAIGDYTDFYAGIHHALTVGKLFRPDAPLLPNYKYVPIAYHGRASSIDISGMPVRRPRGQIKTPDADVPRYEPSKRLDFELELGMWVGRGSELGTPIPIAQAHEHIAGYCLLNDWSARDIQAWEYQPLGPFLAKNFMTSISPWIVTPEALEPFRIPQPRRPPGDPAPLPYLWDESDQAHGALDLDLEVKLRTETMRRDGVEPQRITLSNSRHLYWTAAQMFAHHTSGGCNLRAGDLFGSGTISSEDAGGSLLELNKGGTQPLLLSNGERRTFLLDGDEITMTARAHRPGFATIGFGECRATIVAG